MISNKKKSSIKSLDKNNMPLFDSIENNTESKQANSNISSLKTNAIKNTQPSSNSTQIKTNKPKSLASIKPASADNQNKSQSQLNQKQASISNNSSKGNTLNRSSANKKVNIPTSIFNSASGNISLGMYLQEARVKTGYSLNQVAMITKLNIHYIEAIERDDFKNTPPLIYIKAYVKKLATLYNIDVEKTLNLLKPPESADKQIPSTLIQELQETKQVNQKDEAKIKMIFQISIIALLAVLLICLIIGLVYWFSSGSNNSAPQTTVSKTTSTNNSNFDINSAKTINKTDISKEMEKLIVPQSIKLTELPIPQK